MVRQRASGRVVVTGSAGMLGSHLVRRLLADGHQVHGLDQRQPELSHPRLRHSVGDIRDRALLDTVCAGADALVHTASALPSYPVETIRSVIVDGTRTVLKAAHRAGVRRVV